MVREILLRTSDNQELAAIADKMANLAKTTAKNQRIETELNVATNIQQGVLPHDFDFQRSDFDLFASMHAAKEVGGDFYDFYMLDDRHLAVTVADVSGKGVPAALFMMRGKTILKNLALMSVGFDDAAAVLTLANQQLCQANEEMMFITVFFAILDVHTGELIHTETTAAVKDLIQAVQNDIAAYENGAEQFDDITMLGLRYTGPKV